MVYGMYLHICMIVYWIKSLKFFLPLLQDTLKRWLMVVPEITVCDLKFFRQTTREQLDQCD